ncbi:shikimate dehydrogenase [Nocardioides faecalis]|uniref:shikimate dehydrogenase n=1 Tax=Nocardioides faecalis TaxID=2803858 RepID=UPI0027DD540E|nr:shikimate dehydrogenase [Nocardioides faecalis]
MLSEPADRGAGRFGVVGDPVAHSLSPALHRAGYAALGLTASYDAVAVPKGGLAGFVAGLGPEWGGLSVTAPLKREALALADEVTAVATAAGGANTLVRTARGWRADNTDVPGAVAAIRERSTATHRTATVLGGGATAASVGLALADLGVATITLAVRTEANAAEALAAVRAHAAGPQVAVVPLAEAPVADVVVATIPAAAQTPELCARLGEAAVLFEVTYNDWPTPLVRSAEQAGAVVVSGLDLLVHQAVLQFQQFTGHPGPLATMREAGEQALAAR